MERKIKIILGDITTLDVDAIGTTGKCYVIIHQPLQGDPELTEIQKL